MRFVLILFLCAPFAFAQPVTGWIQNTYPSYSTSMFNVANFGAKGDCVSDDSVAIARAAQAALAQAASRPASVYFPSGCYVYKTELATFTKPVSIIGDGHSKSIISVDPSFAGDVFSWSDVWNTNGGVIVAGVTIQGSRSSVSPQNGFVFYDRADFVYMNDIETFYLNGRSLYFGGALKNSTQAFVRESHFYNMRFFNSGAATSPVVEFATLGSGDRTNTNIIDGLDIYGPYGVGLVLRGNLNGAAVDTLQVSKMRIEGTENGTTQADLLQIGDATFAGVVDNVDFSQCVLIDPYTSYAALRFTAPSSASMPYQIRFQGRIAGGLPNGSGIVINAGRSIFLDIPAMAATVGPNLTISASPMVGGPIWINAYNQESSWTKSIDASVASIVVKPTLANPF